MLVKLVEKGTLVLVEEKDGALLAGAVVHCVGRSLGVKVARGTPKGPRPQVAVAS